MKAKNNTKLPALRVNEGALQGGFKSLNNLQKAKVKGGGNPVCWGYNRKCGNGVCW